MDKLNFSISPHDDMLEASFDLGYNKGFYTIYGLGSKFQVVTTSEKRGHFNLGIHKNIYDALDAANEHFRIISKRVSIIVAFDEKRVIGNKGQIPWYFKEDMKHFKETTMGCDVIYGRKTWESIGKPLPGRINLILSKTLKYSDYFTTVICPDLDTALKKANPMSKTFVIGGEQVYKEALDKDIVDEIIATKVKGEHEGDTFFPELGSEWKETFIQENENFSIVKYEK
jgi:dihydrofolate reductase